MNQLEYRQKLAAEYKQWLDHHTPASVGRDAWHAKWKLWKQVTDEIAQMTGR